MNLWQRTDPSELGLWHMKMPHSFSSDDRRDAVLSVVYRTSRRLGREAALSRSDWETHEGDQSCRIGAMTAGEPIRYVQVEVP